MRSYRPDELFSESGAVRDDIAALAPIGDRRMGANPHANGGRLTVALDLPDVAAYAAATPRPGGQFASATGTLGPWLRDVITRNPDRFRIMGPDETASNRLSAVFEVTNRAWMAETTPDDDHLAPDGRVMEVLSEHLCEGWLEGYLLSGRHGLFNCYEAFTHIVDSMFNQHAKWLKVSRSIDWREPVPSLNYLLSSHVWRQDHNGFSHQDPGFINHVATKRAEVVRVYLPPDANSLLSVADHCLRSRDYVNVIVAGKQPSSAGSTCRRRQHIVRKESACGSGRAPPRRRNPTSSWRAVATSLRSKPSPRSTYSARICPMYASASSTLSTCSDSNLVSCIHTACPTTSSTPCSRGIGR